MAGIMRRLRSIIQPATISIALEGENGKHRIKRASDGEDEVLLPLIDGREPLRGTITIQTASGQRIDHKGITCEFIGQIELFGEKQQKNNFVSVLNQLEDVGAIQGE